ncbi:uncharacterized protein LY79DRAFT_351241 [Colletotrichum navitas]|uniref:C2H2-type domain-containing protein n=1 Tax=Colletotrichum navitas TaxID=681940 RepID=A0AAD8V964_9PEZI|nr:uncharacterized protein LY79DRAFT_351241 [Colletotrichum navitas]KAK1597649.1 hypothetical protein LY79DRAFT_351241 [Colletotrichum navitas]
MALLALPSPWSRETFFLPFANKEGVISVPQASLNDVNIMNLQTHTLWGIGCKLPSPVSFPFRDLRGDSVDKAVHPFPPIPEDGSAYDPPIVHASSTSDLEMPLSSTTASEEPAGKQQSSICAEYSYDSRDVWWLEYHARQNDHKAFPCSVPGCKEGFLRNNERDAHQRRPHLQGHGHVQLDHPLTCAECTMKFCSKAKLEGHANEAQHSPFACICGKTFARLDVLNRHLDCLGSDLPKFPCQFCKRHRGKDGFRRRDHLLQHIRGYHKFEAEGKIDCILPSRRGEHLAPPVCSYQSCPKYRDNSFTKLGVEEQQRTKPFASQSEYTKHMKTAHNFTPFPCTMSGCNKTGSKGYVREKDLINHRKKEHPDAAGYVPEARDLRIACRYPNCQDRLLSSSMRNHVEMHRYHEGRLASQKQ